MILLLKRSEKVRSYQEHWAVVSGGIEAGESPEACSRREIEEETGLGKKDISLIRTGACSSNFVRSVTCENKGCKIWREVASFPLRRFFAQ